jgi:hypothetical protein
LWHPVDLLELTFLLINLDIEKISLDCPKNKGSAYEVQDPTSRKDAPPF